MDPRKPLKILYTNWRGGTAIRTVLPIRVYWGATEWHSQEQWLMESYDFDRCERRTFAMRDIKAMWSDE